MSTKITKASSEALIALHNPDFFKEIKEIVRQGRQIAYSAINSAVLSAILSSVTGDIPRSVGNIDMVTLQTLKKR